MSTERFEEDEKLILKLMDSQAACDWPSVREMLADDAIFEMPFINEKFSGKEHIIERWRPSLERMDGAKFYDVKLRPLVDAGWYIASFGTPVR